MNVNHALHVSSLSREGPPRRQRLLRYDSAPTATPGMDQQGRRAFTLLYALNMQQDITSINALLHYASRPLRIGPGWLHISSEDCEALATALRRDDYALDDDGIQRFKLERGFAPTTSLGPNVAAAYARFARGTEARLNITEHEWNVLDEEGRRALQILLCIGRAPDDLCAVRRMLGVRNAARANKGPVLVGRVSAKRLVSWAHRHGIELTAKGVDHIAEALGSQPGSLRQIASFVADAVTCKTEPQHDYTRLLYQDHVLNRRTVTMLNKASALLRQSPALKVVRGSYDTESCLGAHPHMGGGAVDVALSTDDDDSAARAIIALRREGFAAWLRKREGRGPHIHAVAIGDRELSESASWQVDAYFLGRDGRTRAAEDPHAALDCPLPLWAVKYRLQARHDRCCDRCDRADSMDAVPA